MKYPRIPHLAFSSVTDADDIVVDKDIFGQPWVVTEKIDGSQTSYEIVDGIVQARNRNTALLSGSMDRQFHRLPAWVQVHYEVLVTLLGDQYILFGEWMCHVHTVHYDRLPDWFVAFGLFDKVTGSFLPFLPTMERLRSLGFSTVPLVFEGVVKDRKMIDSFIKKSAFGSEEMEGVVFHSKDDLERFKFVTASFKTKVDNARHWRTCTRVQNSLAMVA